LSTKIWHGRKTDISGYRGYEHLILTMFLGILRRGEQNPNPSHSFAGFNRAAPGSKHASGVPYSLLGHVYIFPGYIGVNMGKRATLNGQCWQSLFG